MKNWLAILVVLLAACSDDGAEGPAGADGNDGVDGSNGANGSNGTNGTNGSNGQDGQPGPIDPTVPPRASNLHILASPLGPPSAELWWSRAAGPVALSAVKVYRSPLPFTEETKGNVDYTTVAGDATHLTVQLRPESGFAYFGVAPVSFTGVEGEVVTTAIDTRQRACYLGANGGPAQVVCTYNGDTLVFPNQGGFALSPTGGTAFAVSTDATTLGLVAFADASPAVATVFTTPSTLSAPTFAPDGTAIAFLSSMNASESCDTDLFVVPAASSSTPVQLTSSTAGGPPGCPVDGQALSATWSPAGDLLSFLAWDAANNRQTLRTIARAGGASVDWTSVDPAHVVSGSVVASGFSPDGKRILFQTNDRALWIGDIPTQTVSLAFAAQPLPVLWAWSPDSSRLAVATTDSINADGHKTYILWLDGGSVQLQTSTDIKDIVALAWSPDGHALAILNGDIVRIRSTVWFDLLFVSLGGAHYSGIVNGGANSYGWSADSRFFAYTVRNDGPSNNGAHVIDRTNGADDHFEQTDSRFFTWSQDGQRGDLGSPSEVLRVLPLTNGSGPVATGLTSITGVLHSRFVPSR